ncbi:amino acid adenylation domain-containing protein, partial [Streptomyces sp. NPDC050564]|uniref:amino acid adenylation domain-containing protein n=1 Tax=Streptomyces sp. NPDC050564 TaxID=3365631 RepID=UPI003795EB9F
VGVEDNFFDLGGHSIKAIALVGALRAEGFEAAVGDVFRHRTVAGLATALRASAGTPAAEPAVVAPFGLIPEEDRAKLPEGLADAFPLAQVQLGMLVEMLADDGLNKYHNTTTFRIRDGRAFDAGALEQAARALVERHEMLRASFALEGYSVPLQLIHPSAEIPVTVHDLRGQDEESQAAARREHVVGERAATFDLERPPLLRVSALVESDEAWWLSVSVCHPITEGWSHRSLLSEVVEGYLRVRGGESLPAPEPPAVRYADFVAAERASLESDEDRGYWRGVIEGHAKFELPSGWGGDETPRPAHTVRVPLADLAPALRAAASDTGTSLKAVLHAAHLKVMSLLTPEEAFHTGLVCSGRPEILGAERVYGMYLNTVPFAFRSGARTWRELVRQVYDQEAALWPHRRFPMPVMQRELADGSRLLDVRFSYLDLKDAQAESDIVDADSGMGEGATEFGLAIAARASGLLLTADPRRLTPAAVDRLASMYRAVLEAVAQDVDGSAESTYLPGGERELVLSSWNDTVTPVREVSVSELIAERAAESPGAVAVEAKGLRLTFGELEDRANRLAGVLRSRGAGAESSVAVLLDRSVDLVVALLAVWRAGAGYVPLDPMLPRERVEGMLADAGVSVAVTSAAYVDRFTVDVVRVDEDHPEAGWLPSVDLDALAYTIFTSGSTGRPKGVQVTHRSLVNHVDWAVRELASCGSGGAPVFSSVAFDLVVPNVWAPLAAGQRVWLFDGELTELGRELAEAGPFSFLKLTPGHLDVIGSQLSDNQVRGLTTRIVVAGEALPGALVERWRQLLGAGRIFNEYGPTEATVGTCVFPIEAPFDGVVPIGRPLPNVHMRVLDAELRPVPVGVVGELYVGGLGVARGYTGDSPRSAERFLPDPHGEPGTRIYRTGDLARWRADGAVEFLGRIDDQVKVRGYRIELGEIRAALIAHPKVSDAAVTVTDDQRLVAYVVGGADDLRDALGSVLPEYMIPSTYIELDSIPLTANGKLDRRALPDPEAGAADTYIAPRSEVEESIAAIWGQVLGLDKVGVEDNFFDLGGHSILAVRLISRLQTEYDLDLPVRVAFERPTVAQLAVEIEDRVRAEIDALLTDAR